MKTNQSKSKSILFIVMFVMLFSGKIFSQKANDYNVCIRNIHKVSANVMELDVWLEWTGTNKQKFQFFQGGLNFNYDGLANGGTIIGSFVAGSADPKLPAVQQAPNWNVNPISKQIRFISAIATPASIAVAAAAPPGFRLGTLRLTNTVPFNDKAPTNFSWSFLTGSKNTTQTEESFYINGLSTATAFLDIKGHNGSKMISGGRNEGCRVSGDGVIAEPKTTSKNLSSLSAYPNPTSGKLTVSFYTETKSKFILKVIDQLGRVVVTDYINTIEGENLKDVDLSNVAKGMYSLSIEMEEMMVQTIPFVVD